MNITFTEEQARKLALHDRHYAARKLRGEWVVWSHYSDHVVEFDRVALVKAGVITQGPALLDAALNAHFARKKGE